VIEEIAPYTNVVFIRDWVDRSNELIVTAEEAGLPIVLCVQGKEVTEKAGQLRRVLTRRTDAILAVCWVFPYHAGFKSGDVVNVGRRIKQEHPGVQYWLASMDRAIDQPEPNHVPSIVDAVVVVEPLDYTPQAVTAKADEYLPAWHKLAAGRPIIWYWLSGVPGSKGGIVPTTAPGTFRACLDAARRHKLAGLAFDRYGDPKGQERVPIDSRPELVEEIRGIAGELGLDASSGAPPRAN
jgi:hypothetical protein